jgi:hypothetical protein
VCRAHGVAAGVGGAGRFVGSLLLRPAADPAAATVNSEPFAATAAVIAAAVISPGTVAVPVDPAALRAMEAILGRGATGATPEAAERVRHAARIVQHARAAAMSSRVVVLTEALARKYYPPGDAGDIRCWRTAFGFGQGTGALALMLAATYQDDTHRRYSNQSRDPFRAMLLADDTAVEALRHAYTSSAATAWKAAEKIGEAWDSTTRTDVLLGTGICSTAVWSARTRHPPAWTGWTRRCRCRCGSRRARWW